MKITLSTTATLLLLSLAACKTVPDSPYTTINSKPDQAFVQFQWIDFTCFTPCQIELQRRTRVTVSKEGYISQEFYAEPGNRDIDVKLELIAVTEGVESTELPDL